MACNDLSSSAAIVQTFVRLASQATVNFLSEHILYIIKLPERILDKRLRERVEPELGEEQLGFRKGRGTTDGMFSLRQLVEKRLEKQGHTALAFNSRSRKSI